MMRRKCVNNTLQAQTPEGVNLHNQITERLSNFVRSEHEECAMIYGFKSDLQTVLIAGREGSNHP